MKTIAALIVCIVLFTGCARQTKDFIGVYDYRVMTRTTVIDTTEFLISFLSKKQLNITFFKMTSFKVDIYAEGENIKGTCSFTPDLEYDKFGKLKDSKHVKLDLKNIHIVNDTLVADLELLKTIEIKIAKTNNESYMLIPSINGEDENEKCNQLAELKGGIIVYKSITSSDGEKEKIVQSNLCSIDKRVEELIVSGYKREKKEYLKKLFSSIENKR